MGSALLDLRQRPLVDVAAAHVQRLVVRTTPHKTVYVSSRTPEGACGFCVVGSLLGHRDSHLCGDNYHAWNMTTSPPLTLSALLPGFVAYLSSERRFSVGTVYTYRENIRWIIRHRGDAAVADIDLQWIVNIKSHLISNGASSSRVAGVTYALKNALIFARDVLGVPVMNVALLRAPGAPRRQVVYLTSDEYNEFVEAIPLYTGFGRQRLSQFCFRALVETLAATGMRISEALALNIDSADLSKGEAVIIGKGNKQRTVFFTERAVTWTNGQRLQPTSVQAMFRRTNAPLFKRIGKRVTPHILRHTAATNLLQRGCPIGHIKEILGHQNLETTCRFYLGQLTKAEVRRAFDAYMHYEVPISELPPSPGQS